MAGTTRASSPSNPLRCFACLTNESATSRFVTFSARALLSISRLSKIASLGVPLCGVPMVNHTCSLILNLNSLDGAARGPQRRDPRPFRGARGSRYPAAAATAAPGASVELIASRLPPWCRVDPIIVLFLSPTQHGASVESAAALVGIRTTASLAGRGCSRASAQLLRTRGRRRIQSQIPEGRGSHLSRSE